MRSSYHDHGVERNFIWVSYNVRFAQWHASRLANYFRFLFYCLPGSYSKSIGFLY